MSRKDATTPRRSKQLTGEVDCALARDEFYSFLPLVFSATPAPARENALDSLVAVAVAVRMIILVWPVSVNPNLSDLAAIELAR